MTHHFVAGCLVLVFVFVFFLMYELVKWGKGEYDD
jgi:hypothetical protein